MTNRDFTIYSKPEYYADLIARLQRSGKGDTAALATMNFEPLDRGVPELIDALCAAAKRGASISFAVDAYNFLVNGKTKIVGPLWYSKRLPKKLPPYYRKKFDALQRIEAAGGRVTITNQPKKAFTQPFGGRSHIKYAVFNDFIFIGGCNLTASDDIDLMVGWQDNATSDWVIDFAKNVDKTGHVRTALDNKDIARPLDQSTDLLLDSGVSGQSMIYDRALEMIDQAEKSVFITCQLFPNSRTVNRLIDAHNRGAKITIIYNSPLRHGIHAPIHQIITWHENSRLPQGMRATQLPFRHDYVHAKLIATEKAAIIGSHNYVPSGVVFGTAEIALLRRDPAFAVRAIAAIKAQLS